MLVCLTIYALVLFFNSYEVLADGLIFFWVIITDIICRISREL